MKKYAPQILLVLVVALFAPFAFYGVRDAVKVAQYEQSKQSAIKPASRPTYTKSKIHIIKKMMRKKGRLVITYEITGAEVAQCNAICYPSSPQSDGVDKYAGGTGPCTIQRVEISGTKRWEIRNGLSQILQYFVVSNSATPPLTGWTRISDGLASTLTITPGNTDTTAPVFLSATTSTDGSSVIVNLTEVDSPPILPATGVTGFSVKVNTVARTVSSTTASGTQVTLNLASPVYMGDDVTVSYASGNVTDSA